MEITKCKNKFMIDGCDFTFSTSFNIISDPFLIRKIAFLSNEIDKGVKIVLNFTEYLSNELIRTKLRIKKIGYFVAFFDKNIDKCRISCLIKEISCLKTNNHYLNGENFDITLLAINIIKKYNPLFLVFSAENNTSLIQRIPLMVQKIDFPFILFDTIYIEEDNENGILAFLPDYTFIVFFALMFNFSCSCGVNLIKVNFSKSIILLIFAFFFFGFACYESYKTLFLTKKNSNLKNILFFILFNTIGNFAGSVLSFCVLKNIFYKVIEATLSKSILSFAFFFLLNLCSIPISFLIYKLNKKANK